MNPATYKELREDVLSGFAAEPNANRKTLERYLKEYPHFASELAGLSRELALGTFEDTGSLSEKDTARIDAAWRKHVEAAPQPSTDFLAALSTDRLREISQLLDVPRQVIAAFRERKVILESVPRRFLAQLADSMNTTVAVLTSALSLPQQPRLAGSYKADGKPETSAPVTFERILKDAGVSDSKRAALMADY